MTEIAATRLSRFGLSADGSACLVEFEKSDGETGRLTFPPAQLDEVIGLLLQLKQVYAQKIEGNETRSVLVADRVGVLVQSDAAVLDFVVGGAPISFAIPLEMAAQLTQILQERVPAPDARAARPPQTKA
ncbi:MAG TPA: hypothetical protein VGM72_00900 [Micropepsaceae bacterium]|jgi:hypothetical protein